MPNDVPAPFPRSTSNGPIVFAAMGVLFPLVLLSMLALRLHIDLTTEMWIFVPGAALAALAVSISMGWIFIEFGRQRRRPKQLPLTMTLLGLGVLMTLAIILIIGVRTAGQYGL